MNIQGIIELKLISSVGIGGFYSEGDLIGSANSALMLPNPDTTLTIFAILRPMLFALSCSILSVLDVDIVGILSSIASFVVLLRKQRRHLLNL